MPMIQCSENTPKNKQTKKGNRQSWKTSSALELYGLPHIQFEANRWS